MKIFLAIVLLIGIFYNIKEARKVSLRTKTRPVELFIIGLAGLGFISLSYIFDKTLLGYTLAVLATGLISSAIFLPGIGPRGVLVFTGPNLILKFIGLKDIDSIKIKESKAYLRLDIGAHSTHYIQSYDKSDRKTIKRFLGENL